MALDDIKKKQLSTAANDAATQDAAQIILDQLKDDPRLYVQRYYLDSISKAWAQSGLPTPAEFIERLSEGMAGTRSFMAIEHSSKDDAITIEFRAAPDKGEDTDFHSTYAPRVRAKMTYGVQSDEMSLDEIYKAPRMNVNGKDLVRKLVEIGYEAGNTKLSLSTWQHGNHVWAPCVNVVSVSPEFQDRMMKRLASIQDDIPLPLADQIKTAIAHGDIKAIAQIELETPRNWGNSAYVSLSEESRHMANPPTITIGKYILYDVLNNCWQGTADLNRASDCARLNSNLSPWQNPALKQRSLLAEQSVEEKPDYAAE